MKIKVFLFLMVCACLVVGCQSPAPTPVYADPSTWPARTFTNNLPADI